jgi:DNA-binding MarR family transcriptional regulator
VDRGTVRQRGTSNGDAVALATRNWAAHGWGQLAHFTASFSVVRADATVNRVNHEILQPLQLTRTRHEALALLFFSRRGELSMRSLSTRLMVHPTSVTGSVDTLERLGYARRVRHPTDRRTVLAQITAAGRRAMRASNTGLSAVRFGLDAIDEAQAAQLFALLKRVRDSDPTDGRRPDAQDPILSAADNWRRSGWDVGPHFTAAVSVYRAAEVIRRSNDLALGRHHLTQSRHEALATLFFARQGQLPMGKLSAVLDLHPTSISSTVATLHRLGLVQRVDDPVDRRTTLAMITAKGRRAIEESNDVMVSNSFGLGALSANQAVRLARLLRAVR